MILLSMAVQSFSQQGSNSQDLLHVKVYDKDGKLSIQKDLKGAETQSIDLESFINEHISSSRVTIYGHYTVNDAVSYVHFDSKRNQEDTRLCKQEVLKFKPTFGISGCSNENFSGFVIDAVAPESPADKLGLIKGDVVYNMNDKEITTYCDLSMAVRAFQIGETVNVEYSKSGRVMNNDIVIAGKGYKTITFQSCDPSLVKEIEQTAAEETFSAELNLYPNPTRETTFLKYDSESNEPVSYYIMDTNGALVYQKDIDVFTGSLRESYSFRGLPAGTYYFVVEQGKVTTKSKVLYIGN